MYIQLFNILIFLILYKFKAAIWPSYIEPCDNDVVGWSSMKNIIRDMQRNSSETNEIRLFDGTTDIVALQMGLQPIRDQIVSGYRSEDGLFDNKRGENKLEQLWTRWVKSKG